MATEFARSNNTSRPTPLIWMPFQAVSGSIGYLGRLAILAISATRAVVWTRDEAPGFVRSTLRHVDKLLGMGLPMVSLVHVGMGSFLAMQAYFGATFVDGIGPVVGVGLIRNLAPLLTGFLVAGLVAARCVGELRGPLGTHLDAAHRDESLAIDPARLAATRIAAAMVVGPILSAWASVVGTVVGFLVGQAIMGVTVPAFFDLFLEMLWTRDIIGLVVKGVAFGGVAALLACHEGLSRPVDAHDDPEAIYSAACRAASLACLAILVLNSGWFLLVYHGGPAFGPTVLSPPTL